MTGYVDNLEEAEYHPWNLQEDETVGRPQRAVKRPD